MKKRLLLFALLPALLLFVCCSDEPVGTTPSSVPEGYMAIEIVVPDVSTPATRILEAADENEVKTIDILAFDADNNKYVYSEEGTDIESTIADGKEKIFYVKIPQDGKCNSIYFMVIANARNEVKAAIDDGRIAEGKTQKNIMGTLTFKVPSSGSASDLVPKNAWPVWPGFVPFPMWGISKVINLNANPIIVEPISLARSVAKIDVGVNFLSNSDTPQGLKGPTGPKDLFKLEKIYVYNAHDKLMIAPKPDSYKTLDANLGIPDYSGLDSPFTKPSIPSPVGTIPTMEYPVNSPSPTANTKLAYMNGIYVAEHEAGKFYDGEGRDKDNFCLVIGAHYGPDEAGKTDITYYRVDFVKTANDGEKTLLPILRNHRYKVNITEVQGRGYDTPEEAFDAMGVNTNITVEITDDNEKLTEFEYDGEYLLGVSKGEFILDKNLHNNVEITVQTTDENGWEATVTSGGDWLTIVGTGSHTGTTESTLEFNVAENGTSNERTGTIAIRSGRLFKKIAVRQRGENFIEIIGKEPFYVMDGESTASKNRRFIVKSFYAWKVKVEEDPYNIIRAFTLGGGKEAETSSLEFKFTLENYVFYQTILDAKATFIFYSEEGKFDEQKVEIIGKSCFDFGGDVYVYPYDLVGPNGSSNSTSWFVNANRKNTDVDDLSVPPAGSQVVPALNGSCAALPAPANKPWRLPTIAELEAISSAVPSDDMGMYNFLNLPGYKSLYWSAETYEVNTQIAWAVDLKTGNKNRDYPKSNNNSARCVRDK